MDQRPEAKRSSATPWALIVAGLAVVGVGYNAYNVAELRSDMERVERASPAPSARPPDRPVFRTATPAVEQPPAAARANAKRVAVAKLEPQVFHDSVTTMAAQSLQKECWDKHGKAVPSEIELDVVADGKGRLVKVIADAKQKEAFPLLAGCVEEMVNSHVTLPPGKTRAGRVTLKKP